MRVGKGCPPQYSPPSELLVNEILQVPWPVDVTSRTCGWAWRWSVSLRVGGGRLCVSSWVRVRIRVRIARVRSGNRLFKVGRLEPVKGDSVVAAVDVHDEVLGFPLEHFVGPIVWLLKWFPGGVLTNENMCACREGGAYIGRSLSRAGRSSS